MSYFSCFRALLSTIVLYLVQVLLPVDLCKYVVPICAEIALGDTTCVRVCFVCSTYDSLPVIHIICHRTVANMRQILRRGFCDARL